jgi:hypothetical protein
MRIHRHWHALLLIVIAAVTTTSTLVAQDEQAIVRETVQRFFDSMATRDTAMAREAMLAEGLSFSTIVTPDGPKVNAFSHRDYLDGLATGTDQWLERMWDAEIRVHGTIATVWAPYEFHINGELSHCGIDAFNLVKTSSGWRIAGIVYTVEPECK